MSFTEKCRNPHNPITRHLRSFVINLFVFDTNKSISIQNAFYIWHCYFRFFLFSFEVERSTAIKFDFIFRSTAIWFLKVLEIAIEMENIFFFPSLKCGKEIDRIEPFRWMRLRFFSLLLLLLFKMKEKAAYNVGTFHRWQTFAQILQSLIALPCALLKLPFRLIYGLNLISERYEKRIWTQKMCRKVLIKGLFFLVFIIAHTPYEYFTAKNLFFRRRKTILFPNGQFITMESLNYLCLTLTQKREREKNRNECHALNAFGYSFVDLSIEYSQ